MGERGTELRPRRRLPEPLEVTLPAALFRCPISLEVMRSPVSLCTGVTYDRSSIQRWLDSGHRTCPATRLPLPSTLLVPNLALRRLILSSSAAAADERSDPSAAEIAAEAAAEGGDPEAAVRVLALMLGSDRVEEGEKEGAIAALAADLDRSVSALLAVARDGRGIGSRVDAVRVLESILASPDRVCGEEAKVAIAEREELFPELVRVMAAGGAAAAEAAIGCMASAAAAGKRRARAQMVRAGAVAAVARAIAAAEVSAAAAERGMALVGAAAGCSEGRAAIAGDAAAVVGALMGRITRVGTAGREAAVAALWAACCGRGGGGGGDKRAREAMLAMPEGLGKILVVMQGECSPAAARMAGDLLRIYTAEAVKNGGGLAGYNSKTIHTMPY